MCVSYNYNTSTVVQLSFSEILYFPIWNMYDIGVPGCNSHQTRRGWRKEGLGVGGPKNSNLALEYQGFNGF